MIQFRDPVHGFIDISDNELRIINTQPFQRLRNIHQLATTYLVYHGAEHTRFGHSIGVMHLASRVFDSVIKKTPNLFSENDEENNKKADWYRQILRIIGLTHDLGHAPFSHASEELFDEGVQHEDYTRLILQETEIADIIRDIGADFKEKYGDTYDITPELIWMIYDGNVYEEKYIFPDFVFLKSFVDGELDCDKMDYLLRDSLFCGVSYGQYDLDRLINTLTACKYEGSIKLAIERGGIQALEEFILARYFMFIQVYFHKTRRYLDKALVQCLKKILPNGKYPSKVEEYIKWDDARVINLINTSNDEEITAYRQREIMTCIYESQAHSGEEEKKNVKIIYSVLCEKFGNNFLIDSIDKTAHKLSPTLLVPDDDSGKGIMIVDEKSGELKNIMNESMILNSIIRPIQINRIYSKKEIADDVRKVIHELQN